MKKALVFGLATLLCAGAAFAAGNHDSAVFLVDVSGTVIDEGKIGEARRIVEEMNKKFPDDVKSGGLMTFGNLEYPQLRWLEPTGDYDRQDISGAAKDMEGGNGPTPIGASLMGSKDGVKSAKGKTALIVVSDGQDTGATDPVSAVKSMKSEMGAELCVFPILLGNDEKGEALMRELADAGGCGRFEKASGLRSDDAVQGLVDFIFGDQPAPPPPPPPKPGDADGDGVLDPDDECPGTPKGVKVDSRGCWVLLDVRFDSGSAEVREGAHKYLRKVADVLRNNPEIDVVIQGHTDSQGSEELNRSLSRRRAESVMNFLIEEGIDADRLSAKGYGESKPIAANDTAEGRQQNRRIEFEIVPR